MSSSDQCAVGPDGQLLSPSRIPWYNDPDDKSPLPPIPSPAKEGRGHRKKDTKKLLQSLRMEHEDDDGNYIEVKSRRPRAAAPRPKSGPSAASKNSFDPLDVDDPEDVDFEADSSGVETSEVEEIISMAEVSDMLPSKTVPERSGRAGARPQLRRKDKKSARALGKRKQRSMSPDGTLSDSPAAAKVSRTTTLETVTDNGDGHETVKRSDRSRNPVYLFYEPTDLNRYGVPGDTGDKHFKCLHGSGKVITVKKSQKYSVNGLVGHLSRKVPPMYRLYEILKDRKTPPTEVEILIASGKQRLDSATATQYLGKLEAASNSIITAFRKQQADQSQWDQAVFERLLLEWIVSTDQAFDVVEGREFKALLQYTHHPTDTLSSDDLKIPGRTTVKRRIMKLGEETTASIGRFFSELHARISISLDAWTSSNGYAFLAIVAHYVTNDGKLEEMLIDFRELVGEHSGENMAEAVWSTLSTYGIEGRVIAFVMDNATNNDTLMDGIESRANEAGISWFNATEARIRCLPHTTHLAALKLLEGIGAIPKADPKQRDAEGAYQDSVTAPIGREHDDEAAIGEDDGEDQMDISDKDLESVSKLRRIVRAVRSSPQRRKLWYEEVKVSLGQTEAALNEVGRMLILDVRTRWSSTHQMLRRALDYRKAIDDFVYHNRELRDLELSDADWKAIELVTDWLKVFRAATTEMSRTKKPMLSSTHAIFRGLQEHLRNILRNLPSSVPSRLKRGLLEAHRKLSDYYYKSDESPYYTWAALLDPRISYAGLKHDFAEEPELLDHLAESVAKMRRHFDAQYPRRDSDSPAPAAPEPTPRPSTSKRTSPQKPNFTKRYQQDKRQVLDELDSFFKLPPEDFETCDPIQWWFARRSLFPRLYRFARDVLAIPGSAVAVERIFSGGRDTISLRRASLSAETIRTLMIVKQHLKMARKAIDELLDA